MHHVYLLRCGDGSLYAGYTINLEARLATHRAGKGAKYTRGRGPLAIAYHAEYSSKSLALKAEAAIKRLSKAAKEELVKNFAAVARRD